MFRHLLAALLAFGALCASAKAQEQAADLIVCGAFGRSRMQEWLFGGITRDLLQRTPVCCLMSH